MEDNQIIVENPGISESPSSSTTINPTNNNDSSSEAEVFDRIANKLLRSGFLLTALELHAELIERGKESGRLRDFFDNPHNFEKHFESSPIATTSNIINVNKLSTLSISNNNNEFSTNKDNSSDLKLNRSPSDKTFDSLDFTHYSDDDLERHGDERIAVLEFELRKAQQTINSLRASLTMSTTGQFSDDNNINQIDNLNNDLGSKGSMFINNKNTNIQLDQTNQFFDQNYSMHDFYFRGSGDGDSCPGEDDKFNNKSTNILTNSESSSISTLNKFEPTSTIQSLIKPHEKRAINYLINEYLMANNYKLTSITFCDENTEQDFDNWDDVGLNINRPPDLLKLFRNFWKNFGSSNHQSSNAAATTSNNILIRSNSNVTTSNKTIISND